MNKRLKFRRKKRKRKKKVLVEYKSCDWADGLVYTGPGLLNRRSPQIWALGPRDRGPAQLAAQEIREGGNF